MLGSMMPARGRWYVGFSSSQGRVLPSASSFHALLVVMRVRDVYIWKGAESILNEKPHRDCFLWAFWRAPAERKERAKWNIRAMTSRRFIRGITEVSCTHTQKEFFEVITTQRWFLLRSTAAFIILNPQLWEFEYPHLHTIFLRVLGNEWMVF
jgi:hypothetical protein